MPKVETNTHKVGKRLEREGWICVHGGKHDLYTNPDRPHSRIVLPRHRTLSPGVARAIAKVAGWID